MDFKDKHIHLMGIGGVGVSSIAQIAEGRGAFISGCDANDGPRLDALRQSGIECFVGHHPFHLGEAGTAALESTPPAAEDETNEQPQ